MEVRDFLYWIQGYFELNGHSRLNKYQLGIIKDHLKLVAKNRDKMSEGDAKFLAHVYYVVNKWMENPAFNYEVPEKYTKQLSDIVQNEFKHVVGKIENAPENKYEPLGDIYNNQWLC